MRNHHALLVIDVQNDFCPGGKLAVGGGHEIVPLVNKLATEFPHVILTQDWHPQGHSSFASQHKGAEANPLAGSLHHRFKWRTIPR
jgi:nicotinamidase/pyrazinamidase